MIESKKRWRIQRPDEQIINLLVNELNIDIISAKVLAARGFATLESARAFLHMDENTLHDPFLLKDMDIAVDLIMQSIENEEKIIVYGDYDADGVSSVTVLMTVLGDLGANVSFMIPNRFTNGYGPSEHLFRKAHTDGASLLITVDNGISGIEEVKIAKELGMKVIVTDHHEPGDELPPADAIIHPRHPGGAYPFGELAGVGVAFKLAHALYGIVPDHLFEIAAIGTIADLVSLQDENRYIVKEGLKHLRTTDRPAIKLLCKLSGVEQSQITEDTIGFAFGPRINAVGRLGDASPAAELFLTDDSTEAANLVKLLDEKNKERQAIVKNIVDEAALLIDEAEIQSGASVIVVAKEGWNSGVVGIVASKLVEKYYRPAIVLSIDLEAGTAKGSARSIEGFHLYNELAKNKDILPHFGGHPMAAGMTLLASDVEELKLRLNGQARECLTTEELTPVLDIDIPLKIEEINISSIESLRLLEPFGMDFSKPKFYLEDVFVGSTKKIGAAQNHIKMELFDGITTLDAVGFGHGTLVDEMTPSMKLSLVGDISINEWNGRKKPQFMIEDVKSYEWQLFDIRGIRQVNRWLPMIPEGNTDYIAFHQETITAFSHLVKVPIQLYTGNEQNEFNSNLVIMDLPEDIQLLKTLMQSVIPKRVYAHFYVHDSRYFEGLPSREHFSWYYAFLKKRQSFQVKKHADELAKHKGWSRDAIIFMTKVFLELSFVKIENGVVEMNSTPEKRDLAEAPSYKMLEQQIQMEQMLLYAPYMELKQWFDDLFNEQDATKEELAWI